MAARGLEPRRPCLARASRPGGGGAGRGDRHHRLAYRGAQHDEHEPRAGRVERGDQASRQDRHGGYSQYAAAGVPELGHRLLEHLELAVDAGRADDGQPARAGCSAHAGAGRRTSARHGGRQHRQSQPGAQSGPDPGGVDRARRRRHGRRLRGIRLGRDRGRRQLHHAQEFRRRADRRAIRVQPA